MYCKSCGKEIDPDSSFCSFCGAKLMAIQARVERLSVPPKAASNQVQAKALPVYDLTYEKERDASVAGVFLLLTPVIIAMFQIPVPDSTHLLYYNISLVTLSLIERIVACIWVSKIAKRQNRDHSEWALFAFIFPSIVLIIIGQKRKLLK